MKILKYSLLSTILISSTSFATEEPTTAPTEQIILPTLIEVVSFCTSDNSCNSVTPIIDKNSVKYTVKYQQESSKNTTNSITDPISGDDD